jgi:hypothetical protein
MRVNDVGTLIKISPSDGLDISSAISSSVRYQKPSGNTGTWTGSVVDNTIQYTTIDGDIDEAGMWYFQAFVELPSWQGSSDIVSTEVDVVLFEE